MTQPNFLQEKLGFDEGCQLDLDRIVVAGHSMGGVTALRVAEADKRVKACLTLDPWLQPVKEDIRDGTFNGFNEGTAIFLLNSSSFFDYQASVEGANFDPRLSHKKMRDELMAGCSIEDMILNDAHHFH